MDLVLYLQISWFLLGLIVGVLISGVIVVVGYRRSLR